MSQEIEIDKNADSDLIGLSSPDGKDSAQERGQGQGQGQAHGHGHGQAPVTHAEDLICGMQVELTATALSFVHNNTTYYFCSKGCQQRFRGNPESYLHPVSSPNAASSPSVTSTSKPAGKAGEPPTASSTEAKAKANTKTKAETETETKTDTEYFCPMHPEIVQARPGSCPECGMSLDARSAEHLSGNVELEEILKRLAVGGSIALLVVTAGMLEHFLHEQIHAVISPTALHWAMMLLTAPVVFWSGAIFFERAWQSVLNLRPNMFTLIALGVSVAFGYSTFATIVPNLVPASFMMSPGVPYVYFEAAAAIIALSLVGQALELRARAQTTDSIKSLLSLAPKTARRISADGSEQEVSIDELRPGDLLRIFPGASVPADGVLVEGSSSVDQSVMTGEPLPVVKQKGDPLLGGTMNGAGSFTMNAEKIGKESLLSQMVELARTAQISRAPIADLVDKVSYFFVPAVIVSALITFWVWSAIASDWANGMLCAIAVLIIACPCALGLATPMSITVAVGRGARSGVLIRNAKALQTLQAIDTVVVDKTGTLTEGKPRVTEIVTISGISESELIAYTAAVERLSEHPLSQAIKQAAEERSIEVAACANFDYLPGKGVSGDVSGHRVSIGSDSYLQSLDIPVEPFSDQLNALRKEGKALILVGVDSAFAGWLCVSDPVKSTSKEALESLKAEGIRIVMLTGDNALTAEVVSRQLGIDEFHAGVMPADKLAVIKKLQSKGHRVAMAGDGINDAAALAQADIGIAMGTGTDIAMQQADVVLVAGNMNGILRAIRLSRATMLNIQQNLLLAFGYNLVAVPLAAGVLYSWLGWLLNPMVASAAMSLSSVSVILNALRLRNVNLD